MIKNIAIALLSAGVAVALYRNRTLERRIEILEKSFMTVAYTPELS